MAEYLIELPHTKKECMKAWGEMKDSELLPKVYWGCTSGVHNAWTITEAENEPAVRSLIYFDVLRKSSHLRGDKVHQESYMESTHE